MRSFRTELENPVVEQDIVELEKKIALFKLGKIDEERFRSLRLARGVYGQRQPGVQMIRIKIPYGKLNARKLKRISEVADEYSTGRLHITTRQDIQIHHVSLERTPELWSELEKDEVTLREACGNTVRNITASETSGISRGEPFDPRPYADALFKYFLRNPICQEMGRKFKISFSNTEEDLGMAFMHDLGFIAKTKLINGEEIKGFKLLIGGGLGSQSQHAQVYSEFISGDEIISLSEAILRVFERYGERNRRMKARMKFLLKEWGLDKLKNKVEEELSALDKYNPIEYKETTAEVPTNYPIFIDKIEDKDEYNLWKKNNVTEQKNGLFAIGIKLRLGDIYTDQARKLATWMKVYSGDELTLTINQNLIIRHIEKALLPTWYNLLKEINLTDIGFNKLRDITACPGTDTCNLGIASSTGLAQVLENVLVNEFPLSALDESINIKISGCMNACGQHMISAIGFQGMSIKSADKRVLPAAQVLLGGGRLGSGEGRFADKVIKVPSKRAPDALRVVLSDFEANKNQAESFLDYYDRNGEKYFYEKLKHLTDLKGLDESDYIDWGHNAPYIKAIGIGECAGVMIDLVATLFFETEEKMELAKRALDSGNIRDSIYHTYTAIINTAKALLISENVPTNTQASIIDNFQQAFIETNKIKIGQSFPDLALRLKKEKPSLEFANKYLDEGIIFYRLADQFRKQEVLA